MPDRPSDIDGARGAEALTDGATVDWPRYECLFCHYRSTEQGPGCPRCGMAYGYTVRWLAQALRLMNGVAFTFIGCVLLGVSAWLTASVLAGWSRVDTWLIWPALYGLGLLFLAGGISAFFGRMWLMRFFLMLLAGGRGPARRRAG